MNSDIHIHLDEISPETAKMLARGCKQLYLDIIAMEYFDNNEDLKTAEKLIAAIEQFLRS